jgi:glycosyltransferase involved in cell wall biosynthesis
VRVLHIQKAAGIGGSERHLLTLLPALSKAGVEVRMCVPAADGAEAFTGQLSELGVPHTLLSAGPDLNPRLVAALVREIRDYRPDLVHTHLIHADVHGQLAARLTGVTGVSSIHSAHRFYRRQPYRAAATIAGHSAARTIAISDHVGRFVEAAGLCRKGTIRVIPYGIDASQWVTSDGERAAARGALRLEPGEIAAGVASRLIEHKGHSFLLRAYAQASTRAPGLRLLVAGQGPLRAELERQASALGANVDFLGFVADIHGFLGACDLLAFPTQPEFGEGFGLAALEAMAAGCPVVATDVASLPQVIGSDRQAGLLVDPANVDELADALVALADDADLRRQMGERARERAVSQFSLEAMVERTLAVYGELH